MSRVRGERLGLAKDRAMEEQSERMNPVQPLKTGTRRGRTSLVAEASEYRGAGATPSMGVSQIRGGRRMSSPSEDGLSGGAMVGAGKGKKPSAEEMGGALATHVKALHGAGFYEDFKRGFASGNVSGPGFEAVSGGVRTGRYEGKGRTTPFPEHPHEGEGDRNPMVGCGKKKRRPAGPDDGRRKRAEIVKKVMASKGLSMIEASRYVKLHNLY